MKLSFNSFKVEHQFDWLAVHDGPDASAPVIANYSGYGEPDTVRTSTGSLFIHFHSDWAKEWNGVKFEWQEVIGKFLV